MRQVVHFPVAVPDAVAVLRSQSLPGPPRFSNTVRRALDQALTLYADLAEPRAVLEEIGREEFARVQAGAGSMTAGSVVARVAPRAETLALFAATLGEPVCLEIRDLFAGGEVVLGYLLDTVASVAADRLADLAADRFLETLGPRASPRTRVLPYSPGYCGWPTRGQGPLFEALRPDEIGVSLNDGFLMWPLKSVSGVLVGGTPETHAFEADFAFCADCATQECRARLAATGD